MEHLMTILVALIGGGAVGLIEFLIRRQDEKSDKTAEIVGKIDNLENRMDKQFSELSARMESMQDGEDLRWVRNSRQHILRFDDELRSKQRHSQEYFDDILSDIDEYEDYCAEHPKFKNAKAIDAIDHIKKVYRECKNENSFI